MKIIEVKEQEDGSAIIELDVTEDEKQLLMELGFDTMIRRGIELMNNENDENIKKED